MLNPFAIRHRLAIGLQHIPALACLWLAFGPVAAEAGSPRLARILPPGGQRGTTVDVQFTGRYLDKPEEVMLYGPGITVESIEYLEGEIEFNGRKERVEPGTRVRVRLKLADDCPLGAHGMRLRTAHGVSDDQRFFVGPFPTVEEDEQPQKRNNQRDAAKVVEANTTVLGRMNDPVDVDLYRVEVSRGQRVSAEIEAAWLEPLGVLPFPERIPYVLKFSRNGKLLLAAGGRGAASGRVVLFDVTTGERLAEIGDEVDIVLAADISANHKFVALGGPSKLVKIYETESGELRHRIKKHTDWVTAMEFSPDGELLATGDRAGGAYVWEAATGGIVFTLGDHRESISDLSWRADSQMLASSSEDGRVILWYAEDGFPTRTINAHADGGSARPANPRNRLPGVLSVEYTRSGLFATVGRDNSARIWRADGNQLAKLDGFTDIPSRVVFSHDGERLIAGDFTGKVRVWSVKDRQLVGELTTSPN